MQNRDSESFLAAAAAFLGFTGVAAGAFGAHALKHRLSADTLAVFETAVRYQLIHAVALLTLASLMTRLVGASARAAGGCWLIGTFLFSGSLYLLVFTGIRAWGAVTPAGGVLLLAGWACLLAAALRTSR